MNVRLKLAGRYLAGRKLRTALTTLAIVLGVMLLFGMNAVMPGVLRAFSATMLATVGEVDMTVTSKSGATFTEALTDEVAEVGGVSAASPSVRKAIALPADSELTAITLVGVDPERVPNVRPMRVTDGRFLTPRDWQESIGAKGSPAAVLPIDVAERLGVGVGDVFTIPSSAGTTELEIVGLVNVPVAPGGEEVFVPLKDAQSILDLDGRISEVDVAFEPGADREAVKRSVAERVGDTYSVSGPQAGSSLYASLQVGQFIMAMFGVFSLAMAGFIILNTFRTVVAERRHDIGMLRAIGASRRTILGIFLTESLLQGLLGTVLGLLAGWGLAAAAMAGINNVYAGLLNLPKSSAVFTPGNFAVSIALGIGVTVLAALIPARAASRITPLEALRPQLGDVHEPAAKRRAWVGLALTAAALAGLLSGEPGFVGVSALLFLVGLVLLTPVITKPVTDAFGRAIEFAFAREGGIARANLQRNPGRSAMTASTMMVSIAIVLGLLGVITSIFAGFIGYVDKSMGADYLFVPRNLLLQAGTVGAGEEFVRSVEEVEGVGDVATLAVANAGYKDGQVQVIGIDPVAYPRVASFQFSEGSAPRDMQRLFEDDTIMVNGIFAAQNGVAKGDRLRLDTPEGPKSYRVVAIASDYLNAKLATTYVSRDALAEDWGVSAAVLLMANAEPGADKGATLSQLETVAEDYPSFKLFDTDTWRQLQIDTFEQSMAAYYVIMAFLALPSLLALLNTLAIGVLARTREIGMLRAVGSTRKQVARMVVAESLLLAALGTLLGIIAGVWLGYVMTDAMNSVGFPMPYFFPWSGIVTSLVIGVLFGVLAAIIPARQASKLDIVAALKYE